MKLILILTIAALTGCSTFTTTQTDERINPKTGETTKIKTVAKAKTFFESKSALTNFKASQTEKNQSANVGSLNQEASGTNTVALVNAVAGLIGALPK